MPKNCSRPLPPGFLSLHLSSLDPLPRPLSPAFLSLLVTVPSFFLSFSELLLCSPDCLFLPGYNKAIKKKDESKGWVNTDNKQHFHLWEFTFHKQRRQQSMDHFFTKYNFFSVNNSTVPLPLGCRDPPGLADEGAVVVSGVAWDVGMIVSMPWVTGACGFFFLVVLMTHSLCKWLWSYGPIFFSSSLQEVSNHKGSPVSIILDKFS